MVFARPLRRPTKHPYRTRIFGPGTDVQIDFRYKHSRVKQYLKEGRALRIETVINKPADLDVLARLEHLPELVAKAREVNRRLLMIERAGQGCAIGSALFERIHQPYKREGQRTGALRFGDPRAMALTGALCCVVHAVTGFTNHSLRGLVAGLLGPDYSTNQMTYDLRRLRLHGLIERVPHTHTYPLTPDGIRVAVFYTKLHHRLLRPLLDAPTNHPHPPNSAAPSPPSTAPSPTTSPTPDSAPPPETCHNVSSSSHRAELAVFVAGDRREMVSVAQTSERVPAGASITESMVERVEIPVSVSFSDGLVSGSGASLGQSLPGWCPVTQAAVLG